jgi:hypothetical protein
MPALVELPAARLVVALSISMFFLVLQHEYKPYRTSEHNFLASLAGAQITVTLLFMSLYRAVTMPRVFGFLCIVLNIILVPLALFFNVRRLKHRKDILNAFLIEHEAEEKKVRRPPLLAQTSDFFDPSCFSEYWKAGQKSEYEVFCATLDWVDTALSERPVSYDRWGQLLFTLRQLPLMSSANADVRHGAWRRRGHMWLIAHALSSPDKNASSFAEHFARHAQALCWTRETARRF